MNPNRVASRWASVLRLVVRDLGNAAHISASIGGQVVGFMSVDQINLDLDEGEDSDTALEYLLSRGSNCYADYLKACRAAGQKLTPFSVDDVEVDPGLRNTGLGIELYVAAAKWAAKKNGVIVAMACWHHANDTSLMAKRVWESRRFRAQVRVFGLVAWAG